MKKLWNMKVTVMLSVIGALGALGIVPKWTGGLGNKRTSGDCPNNRIVEIGQNTEKSSTNLRRLAVTRTAVKNHQLTLV